MILPDRVLGRALREPDSSQAGPGRPISLDDVGTEFLHSASVYLS